MVSKTFLKSTKHIKVAIIPYCKKVWVTLTIVWSPQLQSVCVCDT